MCVQCEDAGSVDPVRFFWSFLCRVGLPSRRNRGTAREALRLRCLCIKGTEESPLAVVSDKDTERDRVLELSERVRSISSGSSEGDRCEAGGIEGCKSGCECEMRYAGR